MKVKRTILIIGTLLLLAAGYFVGIPLYRIRSFDAAHRQIGREWSEAAVLNLMGQPDRAETAVHDAFWDDASLGDDVARQVVKQYWYTVKGPLLMFPLSWTVGFDANGRIISKHRWD